MGTFNFVFSAPRTYFMLHFPSAQQTSFSLLHSDGSPSAKITTSIPLVGAVKSLPFGFYHQDGLSEFVDVLGPLVCRGLWGPSHSPGPLSSASAGSARPWQEAPPRERPPCAVGNQCHAPPSPTFAIHVVIVTKSTLFIFCRDALGDAACTCTHPEV